MLYYNFLSRLLNTKKERKWESKKERKKENLRQKRMHFCTTLQIVYIMV